MNLVKAVIAISFFKDTDETKEKFIIKTIDMYKFLSSLLAHKKLNFCRKYLKKIKGLVKIKIF